MVDKRFNQEVASVLRDHLKVNVSTGNQTYINETGQPIVQTKVIVSLFWDETVISESETIIAETLGISTFTE